MKNILVPTDFSACAGYALDTAIQLAQRFDAKLYLLTSFPILGWTKPKVEQQWHLIQEKHPQLDIRPFLAQGKLATSMEAFIEQHGIDFIVMGSHGASGKQEYFVGSNTQKVIRKIHQPVMVVKSPIESFNFDKVVFASNFTQAEQAAFLKFRNIVKHFVPEIHLVYIQTASLFEAPAIVTEDALQDFKALSAPFSCHTHMFKSFSVDQGIRQFSEKIGAKLIGISNLVRHPVKRMLVGSNVEALINHADVPVLSIDFPQEQRGM